MPEHALHDFALRRAHGEDEGNGSKQNDRLEPEGSHSTMRAEQVRKAPQIAAEFPYSRMRMAPAAEANSRHSFRFACGHTERTEIRRCPIKMKPAFLTHTSP
jgi:hypothetical protein